MLWKADNGAVALGMNFHIRVFRSSFVFLDVETFSCRHVFILLMPRIREGGSLELRGARELNLDSGFMDLGRVWGLGYVVLGLGVSTFLGLRGAGIMGARL